MQDEEAIDAFVGSNAEYYRDRWRRFSESPGSVASFNLAACIGQVIWLAYRKLHLALFWLLVATVADVALVLYVEEHEIVPAGVITAWNTIVAVLFLAVPGFCGNYWYWRRFRRAEQRAASGQRDRDEQLQFIRAAGGTNSLGAGLLVALFVAPVLWAGYWASHYEDSGYVFDATGPLTIAEVEANSLSRMDGDLIGEQRECLLREIEERARAAGDPETLDPATVEFLPAEGWEHLGRSGRRLILTQVITTKAFFVCQ